MRYNLNRRDSPDEVVNVWRTLTTRLAAGSLLCLSVILAGCGAGGVGQPKAAASPAGVGQAASPAAATLPIPVTAGFYPLAEATKAVGGDRVTLTNLVPPGGEPHDYEPSPRDLERLRQARLLVYLNEGFQPSLERVVASLETPNLKMLDVLQGVPLLEGEDQHAAEEKAASPESDGDHEGEENGDHAVDPHIWLDPVRMKAVTDQVSTALSDIDPAGASTYEANAQAYKAKLDALDAEFKQGLQGCRLNEFITSHAAFAYLANRYNLEQIPVRGLSPEIEPSPQRVQDVIRLAKDYGITVIYFETLVNPRVAETIAREVGAEVKVLNPIEGLTPEQEAQGLTYFDLMRENLVNLRAGLGCGG